VKINVREFGAHDGSSPATNSVTAPPPAGTTQISKSRICDVNAIHLPSGDQSGSVGLETPAVGTASGAPPDAETFRNTRRSFTLVA